MRDRIRLCGVALCVSGFVLAVPVIARADNWTTATGGQITSGAGTRVGVGITNPAAQVDVAANTAGREGLIVNQQQATPVIARFRQNGSTKMLLTAPGNLGIGTTTPTEKLHVIGNVQVTGFINADGGLKIKSTWSLEAPDYVFEPTYALMSMSDIERFVKANKHLPEIPSAAELTRDGMNVAEMNLLLLKKVEELTLHVIEQDKKIAKLSAAVR